MTAAMIELCGIIIAERIEQGQNNEYIIINPYQTQWAERPDEGNVGFVHYSLQLVLVLFGGRTGEEFNLSITVAYPPGDDRNVEPLQTKTVKWLAEGQSYTLAVNFDWHFVHMVSGVYTFRLLADGNPLGEAKLPIYWRDELAQI